MTEKRIKPREYTQQGRLTRAGRPDNRQYLARREIQIYTIKNSELTFSGRNTFRNIACGNDQNG